MRICVHSLRMLCAHSITPDFARTYLCASRASSVGLKSHTQEVCAICCFIIQPCGQSGSPPWVHRLQWQSCHAGCDAGVPLACAGISAATVMAALRAARAAHGEVLGAMEGAVAAAGPPEPRFGQVAIEPAQIGRFIGAGAASLQSQPW